MYFAFLILSILIWRDGCSRGPAGYGADSGKSRAEAGYRVVQRENAADMDGPKEQRQKPLTDAYIVQDHPAKVSLVYKMFIIFVKYAGRVRRRFSCAPVSGHDPKQCRKVSGKRRKAPGLFADKAMVQTMQICPGEGAEKYHIMFIMW